MRSLTPGEDSMLESLRIRKWSTVATLAFLLYEHTITFREEVSHIWRRPVTAVRATFMFSRYFTLIVQTVNVYLVLGPFSATTIAESTCKKWFLFQITAACALMTALDLILMLMIYALYRKNKRIGILLTTLFFAQIIVESALSPKAVLDVSYDPICDTTETHSVTIYFCMSVWITHISLAALTGFKKDLLALGAPVVKRVIRDGTWILVVVCSLFATIVPYSFAHQVSQGHVVFGCATLVALT
ncbi:hypothetical protein CPB84DRAFT_1491739 [Gymnopilus junonius]|uniref:DUF6533 domain-containing protein n=1 Tax=Gymnopilus junonius TaxID=109634 RepID=A0A9P5NJQ2_GYMJU|nr:hypothetical protein CPB84DRAFT_1491739 [Gymnopilus junonius]